jgi:hypothetical protein
VISLTSGHVEQLRCRSRALDLANIERLSESNGPISSDTLREIVTDLLAIAALDRLCKQFYARYAPADYAS